MSTREGSASRWDFFVSYTQADRAWAEWIAWILEEDGYRVLIQAWDFVPGSNWVQSMQEGVTQAERTMAVLSAEYLQSVYGGAEWQAAWSADPTGRGRRLLTVRVEDCDRPGFLSRVVGIDVFGLDEVQARARVRTAVASALEGRAKPAEPPSFPARGRALPRPVHFPGAMPTIWKVPARNPNFVGRDEALAEMARALRARSMVTVHSLRGLGGVGKTQLAVEYAHTHASDYDLVWWVAAEERAALPDQLTQLAVRLGLEPVADPDELRAQLHEALRQVAGWLLVFDNADDVESIARWLPGVPLPPGIPGHVVVTTRRSGFAALGKVLDVEVLSPRTAARLLRVRVPGLDRDVAAQIAEALGRLPLALEQAAAYLDRTQMAPGRYLELLKTRTAEMLAKGFVASRADATVATLWNLSLDKVREQNQAAVQLLGICAYLAPESIPEDLFTNHAERLPEPLMQAAADELAFNETVGALVDYALAKRTASGLQVHRLVQAAVRAQHLHPPGDTGPQQRNSQMTPASASAVSAAAEPWVRALALLRADLPSGVDGAAADWPRWWAVSLPHVLAATDHVDTVGSLPPEAAANVLWLLDRAGTYLQIRGRLDEARDLARRALPIAEAAYGLDHPTVVAHLKTLAWILRERGDAAGARPLAERALAITEATYGPDHPEVALALGGLAWILQELGDAAGARPLAERALAITEATYGPDHPQVALALGSLAWILQELGDAAGARPLAERALAITEATYGPDHPTVAFTLGGLASILRELGDAAGARPLAERGLAITEAIFGPDHPTVTFNLGCLAWILRDLGDTTRARRLVEQALAITEARYGPDHPAVIKMQREFASYAPEREQADIADAGGHEG